MQAGVSILLVHSDPAARTQLQSILTNLGYTVDVADNLEVALGAFGRLAWDLAITDFTLQDRSGLALVQAAREQAARTAVIVVGDRRQATALAALRGGAADYLPMPIDASELAAAVERARQARSTCPDAQVAQWSVAQTEMARLADLPVERQLAATLAHEINNPLTPIISLAELLLEDLPADHPGRSYATAISAAAWRIHDVVRSLYDTSEDQDGEETMRGA